jgi:hypothetical protein
MPPVRRATTGRRRGGGVEEEAAAGRGDEETETTEEKAAAEAAAKVAEELEAQLRRGEEAETQERMPWLCPPEEPAWRPPHPSRTVGLPPAPPPADPPGLDRATARLALSAPLSALRGEVAAKDRVGCGGGLWALVAAAGAADGGASLKAALAEQERLRGALHVEDARRVLAAAVVAEQPEAARAILSAVVVAEMPDAPRLEQAAADAGGDADWSRRAGVKVRLGRDGAAHAAAAAANFAANLCHVGTAFFDGVPSPLVRARLSELFAGGVPLVGGCTSLHSVDPGD